MSNGAVILQIFFISVGMVLFGYGLNWILGLRKEKMSELRGKAKNLQERMRIAQTTGDYESLRELQQESVNLTKEMMKKQMLPMCIRCFIFIGLFAVLNFVYADYASGLLPFPILFFGSGWFGLYFLFSIGITLLIYVLKKVYYKATGKETKSKSAGLMDMLSASQIGSDQMSQMSSQKNLQIDRTQIPQEMKKKKDVEEKKKPSDSWKEKLKK